MEVYRFSSTQPSPTMIGGGAPGTPSAKQKEKPMTMPKTVVALYNYKAMESGDLSLEKNQEYEVIDMTQEHWWKVKDTKGQEFDFDIEYGARTKMTYIATLSCYPMTPNDTIMEIDMLHVNVTEDYWGASTIKILISVHEELRIELYQESILCYGYLSTNFLELIKDIQQQCPTINTYLACIFRWYVNDMSRQKCESLLKQEDKEGCFVVRNSSTKGLYTLSLYTKIMKGYSQLGTVSIFEILIQQSYNSMALLQIMRKCWNPQPENRPSFEMLKKTLISVSKSLLVD
ncbi:hypothetical protein NQ318_015760 [Aromia moschata]|uniref:Tyrosine-protein kinase n=1 Tax=Aromia moschata TaxID=1265417 RepID=A0AAV8XNL5_9CUCU|nr:hypothetical protein NQ318_015760 [Aromia moschata]